MGTKTRWTLETLGRDKRSGKWFAYPFAGPDVTVKVESEFPEDVVNAANRIEQTLGREGSL
jgi:hypothetical protein